MQTELIARLEAEARIWEPSPLTALLQEAATALRAQGEASPAPSPEQQDREMVAATLAMTDEWQREQEALQGYICNNPDCARDFYVPSNEEAYTCPMCGRGDPDALTGPSALEQNQGNIDSRPASASPAQVAQERAAAALRAYAEGDEARVEEIADNPHWPASRCGSHDKIGCGQCWLDSLPVSASPAGALEPTDDNTGYRLRGLAAEHGWCYDTDIVEWLSTRLDALRKMRMQEREAVSPPSSSSALERVSWNDGHVAFKLRGELRHVRLSTRADGAKLWTLLHEIGEATAPPSSSDEAERTVRSLSAMLGWGNVPPRETLEAEIRTLKALAARPLEGEALRTIDAVIHQLTVGEASDARGLADGLHAVTRDYDWCVSELRRVAAALRGEAVPPASPPHDNTD